MADPRDDEQPEYTLYRSRRRPFGRGGKATLDPPPKQPQPQPAQPEAYDRHPWDVPPPEPPKRTRRRRRRLSPWRLLAYLVAAVAGWLLISLVLFLVSAQIEASKVTHGADAELTSAGFPLTSANTILVLGSDARVKGTHEAGAQTIGQPSRSDSIMLLRIGGGHNATLSIPRDTVVPIPGHGSDKINAAYAYGGPALAARTVEQFLGIEINHIVEVNFENFPQLIDALGGITYKGGCVVGRLNGGFKNGGYTLRLKAGTHKIDGKQALALARVRENLCNPKETDLTREHRQQKMITSIKDQVKSFSTFIRLPWVSWAAPKAIRTDMGGPSLLGLVGAELTGGSAEAQVLKPTGTVVTASGGDGLTVSSSSVHRAVAAFMKG